MICENCKERPASVFLSQEGTTGSMERQLCEKCAFQSPSLQFDPSQEPLSIQQFLSQWFGGQEPMQAHPQTRGQIEEGPACPECGLTFPKFLDIGKFGCAMCYETFRARLPRVLGKLHNGHASHTGKIPASFNEYYSIKKKVEEIRLQMKAAVEDERFEEAARLRDEANALKERLQNGGGDSDVL